MVVAAVAGLVSISPAHGESTGTAVATQQAVRLGKSQAPETMLREIYRPELVTIPVVIGFKALAGGGSVPWRPQDHPECVGAAPEAGRCVLLSLGWPRLAVELQRSYLAHEWAHVLEQQYQPGLMVDECLAEEIAEQALAAVGYTFIRHYLCSADRAEDAADVLRR